MNMYDIACMDIGREGNGDVPSVISIRTRAAPIVFSYQFQGVPTRTGDKVHLCHGGVFIYLREGLVGWLVRWVHDTLVAWIRRSGDGGGTAAHDDDDVDVAMLLMLIIISRDAYPISIMK